jgi:hypothetical protein
MSASFHTYQYVCSALIILTFLTFFAVSLLGFFPVTRSTTTALVMTTLFSRLEDGITYVANEPGDICKSNVPQHSPH